MECMICLEEINTNELFTLYCGHRYHNKCILRWMEDIKHTCPLCRNEIILETYYFEKERKCSLICLPKNKYNYIFYTSQMFLSIYQLREEIIKRYPMLEYYKDKFRFTYCGKEIFIDRILFVDNNFVINFFYPDPIFVHQKKNGRAQIIMNLHMDV